MQYLNSLVILSRNRVIKQTFWGSIINYIDKFMRAIEFQSKIDAFSVNLGENLQHLYFLDHNIHPLFFYVTKKSPYYCIKLGIMLKK